MSLGKEWTRGTYWKIGKPLGSSATKESAEALIGTDLQHQNTITTKSSYSLKRNSFLLWCHQESNRGHKDFQSFALPTELWHQLYETNEDCSFASAKVAFLFRSTKFFLTFLSKKFKKAANILFYIVFSVTLRAILRGMR